jgi:hypothetical protein
MLQSCNIGAVGKHCYRMDECVDDYIVEDNCYRSSCGCYGSGGAHCWNEAGKDAREMKSH